MLFDRDAKLWAGYAFIGARHRVFFSGDTGLHPAMRDIGARLGPFDVTMIEVGQYNRAWPDWHIGPEQALIAHGMLRGKVMLPMHWGLFKLAPHGWTEPIERAVAAGAAAGATIVTPRPGESIEPEPPPAVDALVAALPWSTAAETRSSPPRWTDARLQAGGRSGPGERDARLALERRRASRRAVPAVRHRPRGRRRWRRCEWP